jgi:dienelactone hydrolase
MRTALLSFLAFSSIAADFKDIDPNVFGKDDPRSKDLSKMVWTDARRRMQEANLRESKAFAAVQTKEQWEKYRDERIAKLKSALGTFPEVPKNMRIVVTRKLDGDGFVIHNIVYETRPNFWASANLYLPAKPVANMPGLIISHAHHTPKTHGELQDMGMTWARSGCAVLVPDHLGHGERRNHDFITEKDYPKSFRPSRQDYYFRYNSNLQLQTIGDSLMGWMAWDLKRGIDVLLQQPGIDRDRIILLGAVAGGGDPAGVTAALDPRITCLVPFNFGGWQPESSVLENPDRDFDWFGDGYWESTRGLRGGAAGGFAHFVIVGSMAPKPMVYSHEFAWNAKTDPAWPRLQKMYDFYGAKDKLAVAHGSGTVRNSGPGNTHCTHIGAVHRKMIYPALKQWFGMPIPEEYSQRRPAEDLLCWTKEAREELKPKKLHEVVREIAGERFRPVAEKFRGLKVREWSGVLRERWGARLGNIEPAVDAKLIEGRSEEVPGGKLSRLALEVEPGIVVPFLLGTPNKAQGRSPVVVMVAQGGKAAFLKERGDAIEAFLKEGVAVCLVDVRGTGETQFGTSAGRGSLRTSVSQTNLILGRTVIGDQLRDLRSVIRWLQNRTGIDGAKLAIWGDSFARTNPPGQSLVVPQDAPETPAIAEPGGALLALLAALYEDGVKAVYARGGLGDYDRLLSSAYLYAPHESVVPGAILASDVAILSRGLAPRAVRLDARVTGLNQLVAEGPVPPIEAATWMVLHIIGK